jgi:hypothetical protein
VTPTVGAVGAVKEVKVETLQQEMDTSEEKPQPKDDAEDAAEFKTERQAELAAESKPQADLLKPL